MAKTSGLGDAFYIGGYDISGDVNSLTKISGSQNVQDVTDITQFATSRLGLLRDGEIDFNLYFDPALNAEHTALSSLPTTDAIGSYYRGTAVGNPAASINAKQLNYDWTRANDGSLAGTVTLQANAYGLEWGTQLTPGKRTDTSATVGSFYDNGAGFNFGAQAYIQVFAFTGTSVTIDIQSATTSGGSYTTTGLTTTAISSAPTAVRLSVSNVTTINEFLKVVTTGTFTNAVFAVQICVNPIAGVVF